MGTTMAWIVLAHAHSVSRIARALPAFPALPAVRFSRTTSWIQLYSPQTGLVNLAINHVFGLEKSIFNVFSMGGMIADVGFAMAPLAYLMMLGPLGSIDKALEESFLRPPAPATGARSSRSRCRPSARR